MNLWNQNFSPMLLKEIDKPFNSKDYIFEIKFDGIRALIFVNKNSIKIINRNKKDITYLYPELKEIKKIVIDNTILDGEIVVMDKKGPSFSKLQERNNLKDETKIKIQSIQNPVIFVCFDILYQGKDLTNLSLLGRKEKLEKINENEFFIKSKVFKYDGVKLFNEVQKLHLEGIVAKKIDSRYLINTRSEIWLKIKNNKEEEFFICGFKLKKNGLSLLLGEMVKGNKFYYVGNVLVTKNRNLYNEVLSEKVTNKNPFSNYDGEMVKYLYPKLKCEVKYLERTKTNRLRQPFLSKNIK